MLCACFSLSACTCAEGTATWDLIERDMCLFCTWLNQHGLISLLKDTFGCSPLPLSDTCSASIMSQINTHDKHKQTHSAPGIVCCTRETDRDQTKPALWKSMENFDWLCLFIHQFIQISFLYCQLSDSKCWVNTNVFKCGNFLFTT